MPPPLSAQLSGAARRLAALEQARARLAAQLDEARQVRHASAGRAQTAELSKLQDRIQHAAALVQRLRVDRAGQIGRLEKAERLLESCERSLQALSLDDTPAASRPVPDAVPSLQPMAQAAVPSAASLRIAPEEAAAQRRVQQLADADKRARADLASARQVLQAAKKALEAATGAAMAVTNVPDHLPLVDRLATERLGGHLLGLGLPPVDPPPARGRPDLRFTAYVGHFTEVGADGTHTLKADFQAPQEAFAAFAAIHGAVWPNTYKESLLKQLLPVDIGALGASLRDGGEDLEGVARPMVTAALHHVMTVAQGLVDSVERSRDELRPRRVQLSSGPISRNETRVLAENYRTLLQLPQAPGHRAAIVEGAVQQLCELLRSTVLPKLTNALEDVAEAADRLEQAKTSQRPIFQRSVDAERELTAAREEIAQLATARRQREAEAARAAAAPRVGPSDAAIPRTEIASSSAPDPEARQMKLRGDIAKHTESVATARQSIDQLDAALRQAEVEQRRAEDEYETADAAQARGRAGARRQHAEQRDTIKSLRHDLDELEAQVERARTELDQHPARRLLVSDRAWGRAVERHVEPDDAALRARILAGETGRNGAYNSRADLALAVADIHAHLTEQPDFRAVLAARTRAEFEHAAAALPGGVTDLVHDHGRQVGRGFSSAPDQTERPAPLTQSSFSLQFVQGRVVVSHLYPHVPHRQLSTS
jgi:hypothetical protein